MVLVSLLVDQLSSLFLPFYGRPKKNCSVSGNFWSGSDFFLSTKFLFGIPKNQSLTKNNSGIDQKFPETKQIFFWSTKKGRNRPYNWLTKRLTKTTWTGLKCDVPKVSILELESPQPFCKWLFHGCKNTIVLCTYIILQQTKHH